MIAISKLKQNIKRSKRRIQYSAMALLFFRYRYLFGFIAFGFISILVELSFLVAIVPKNWSPATRTISAFSVGLCVSFILNALFNFKVPHKYFATTFIRFALVSVVSFAVNLTMMWIVRNELETGYATSRLMCSGLLFFAAYGVHRKLTFQLDRNFGIAVYAAPQEHVRRIWLKVGRNCDHIHVDLVDGTFKAAAQVDLSKIDLARQLWPDVPFALHLMTRRADLWLEQTLSKIDWFLFSLASDVDLLPLFTRCQLNNKKVGVVWHSTDALDSLYLYLSHVDFVMVLGIAKPGQSGQSITPEAIAAIQMLERLKHKYHYELMFDGSVNTQTVSHIPARYIVAASSVLKANQPARVIYTLKTGARHERRAA